jgi:hypothetical protein
MFRFLTALVLLAGVNASATTVNDLAYQITSGVMSDVGAQGFSFKVGDTASYSLNMGGFIKGDMVMTVKAVEADSVTISQDMNMGFLGKQACEIVLNPNTGEQKSMVCNGQAQKPGDKDDVTLVESKEDTVKVPAGTFTCLYIKAHSKSQNADIEQWVNPKIIAVFGLAKTLAPSQFGQVTIELTSFKKN